MNETRYYDLLLAKRPKEVYSVPKEGSLTLGLLVSQLRFHPDKQLFMTSGCGPTTPLRN